MDRLEILEVHWTKTIPIRHKVLWPNKPKEFCHVENDQQAWHFAAYLKPDLVSVASVYPDETSTRLRKFSTIQEFQGKGFGSALLNHIQAVVKKKESAISGVMLENQPWGSINGWV